MEKVNLLFVFSVKRIFHSELRHTSLQQQLFSGNFERLYQAMGGIRPL